MQVEVFPLIELLCHSLDFSSLQLELLSAKILQLVRLLLSFGYDAVATGQAPTQDDLTWSLVVLLGKLGD